MEGKILELEQEISGLKKSLEESETMVGLLKEENEALKKQVQDLLDTPDAEENKSGVGETFELNGEKYRILAPSFRIPKVGKVTAADLLASAELQAQLVQSGSSVIQKLS